MNCDLWGKTALDYTVDILQTFEPDEGYHLAFSGGKDSIAIKAAADIAAVTYDAHYQLTGIDPPSVVRSIKKHHPDVQIHLPEKTMWQLIAEKGMLPTRRGRWCCDVLKERGGQNRLVLTGVRSAESPRRAARKMVEVCRRYPNTKFVHAIKHWTDGDVWDFIREQKLPYPSLYDEGFKRLGCILCPFSRNVAKEIARWPKIAAAWRRAARRAFETAKRKGRNLEHQFKDGDEYFDWWLDRDASMPKTDDDQCSMFGE